MRIGAVVRTYKNVMTIFCTTQDNYIAVTVERGEIFLHSNLLDAPTSKNVKKFPVRKDFVSFCYHLASPLPTTANF